jgi:AAA domain/Bifunctional DNA primase/polymerase, N-terminal/Primase C terminal 1 (PriCT-1)
VSITSAESAAHESRGAPAVSDTLDAALRYAQAGFNIIPVRRGTKLPLTPHGAHDASADTDVIGQWFGERWRGANIGLTLGGLVAIDVDPRNGGDVNALPNKLPDTCIARTGGGGMHYLYQARAGARYPGQLAPGIDCKSGPGSYIVVEPSIHPSGGAYFWIDESEPWDRQPAEAPAWLGQLDNKTQLTGKTPQGARNATLTSVAGVMRREGMALDALEAALLVENAARCSPPLPDDEVRRIARSVARYEPAVKVAIVPPVQWPAPLDIAAMASTEPVAPRHIVEPWLPAGEVTLLAGHGGAGKSYIALQLAVCLALGRPWYGLPAEQRRVMYLSLEDGRDVLHWRLGRICARLAAPMGELAGTLLLFDASHIEAEMAVETRDGPMLTPAYDWLRELMRDAQVLVVDGASDTYGGSEIIRRQVRYFIRALRRLVPSDGAVLLLAHVDKQSAKSAETSQGYSGSTAWNNSVRARWYLRAEGDGLLLELSKANNAAAGAQIRLRWDPTAMLYVAETAPVDGGMVKAVREREERDGIVAAFKACAAAGIDVPAATTGRRTAYHVLAAQPSFPASLSGDSAGARRQFWRLIEELRAIGTLREKSIRRSDRHYVCTLEISTEGPRACGQS